MPKASGGVAMRALWALFALAVVGGCVKEVPPEEQKVFGRLDCQRAEGNPMVQQQFEQARTICLGRAQAAAIAGTAAMPTGHGLGGAIASGIQQGMAQREIGENTAISCMAEQGYIQRTRAEHEAACAAIQAQQQQMAAAAQAPLVKRKK
jgi:hypothetical protein